MNSLLAVCFCLGLATLQTPGASAHEQISPGCYSADNNGTVRKVDDFEDLLGFNIEAATAPSPPPYCGDNTAQLGEACDDGNDNDNDTCAKCCYTKHEVVVQSVGRSPENQTAYYVNINGHPVELKHACKLGDQRNFKYQRGGYQVSGLNVANPKKPLSNDYLEWAAKLVVKEKLMRGLKRVATKVGEKEFEAALAAEGEAAEAALLRFGAVPVVWFSVDCCVAEQIPVKGGFIIIRVWKNKGFRLDCKPGNAPKKAFNAANREEMLCATGECVRKAQEISKNVCKAIKYNHCEKIDVDSTLRL